MSEINAKRGNVMTELRTSEPEVRQGRAGAGRKLGENPFREEWVDEVMRTGEAREFDVRLTEGQHPYLRKAYYRRELTKAAKLWELRNGGSRHSWPTLALRFDHRRGQLYTVRFWQERTASGEGRYTG